MQLSLADGDWVMLWTAREYRLAESGSNYGRSHFVGVTG